MSEKEEFLIFIMTATKEGIRTNEEFEKAMVWIGGEEWMNKTPDEWRNYLRETRKIYIDGSYGECLEKMFKEYKKHALV